MLMNELSYLIYLLVFIIGSIAGLLISYKKHGEPFILNGIDIFSLIMAIVGWVLLINYGLIVSLIGFVSPEIIISIALFLIAFILGMRPGYGRKETVIGVIVSIIIWIFSYLII
jgi:energy-converting hydrogenase A subunit L